MAYLIVNAQVWDGENDERYPAEVLIEHNRITAVARGQGQIRRDGAEVIDGGGMTLMPGMVEGHCHLSFVGPARNQDLGEIPAGRASSANLPQRDPDPQSRFHVLLLGGVRQTAS